MGLTRQEIDVIVQRVIAKDQAAFETYVAEWGTIVKLHAQKWGYICNLVSLNLYDYEDIEQEIWEYIICHLDKYDSSKANMTTWLYEVCKYRPSRILTYHDRKARSPLTKNEDGDYENYQASLNTFVGIDEDSELMDFIIDPQYSINNNMLSELEFYEYIYVFKNFIQRLKPNERVVYMHMILGMVCEESGAILGCTRANISRIRLIILEKLMNYMNRRHEVDLAEADMFSINLIGNKTDDELSEELNCDISIIKLCREVLSIANLYDGKGRY